MSLSGLRLLWCSGFTTDYLSAKAIETVISGVNPAGASGLGLIGLPQRGSL